ncbi:XRE family transcriptional regulator [Limibacter armeniacum]|uniref:helix-turn-helix domain-containing protein n=1 Tax=Limibacter armeniacum TaxID=466084 RepID=UPI002FE56778
MAIKDESLGNIGKAIKEIRQDKRLSLQEVSQKSDVTPSLLSKIENFRTVPSLPVLFNIARALDVDMAELVRNVRHSSMDYILIRKGEVSPIERSDSEGLRYFDLISQAITNVNMRVNLVEVSGNVHRPPIATNGLELLYVIHGDINYGLGEEMIELHEGDTLFFDGNIPHSVTNDTDQKALLFKVYLMDVNG